MGNDEFRTFATRLQRLARAHAAVGPAPLLWVMCADDPLWNARRGLSSGFRALGGRSKGAMEAPQQDEVASREMLDRARSGDPDAFAGLFALHREGIQRLCRRMLDDLASAEDATSEVFLRARRSLASYDSEMAFSPWLRRVASNYCLDQLRRRKVERGLFSAKDLSTDELADDSPGALLRLTSFEERREVLDALDELPAKYRLPLVLRFYRELDYDAIAEVLGVTRNQVGTLLFRAKKRLRQQLTDGSTRVSR